MFGNGGGVSSAGMALLIMGAALLAMAYMGLMTGSTTMLKIAGVIMIAIGLLLSAVVGPAVQKKNDDAAMRSPPPPPPGPPYPVPPGQTLPPPDPYAGYRPVDQALPPVQQYPVPPYTGATDGRYYDKGFAANVPAAGISTVSYAGSLKLESGQSLTGVK